MAAGRRVSFHEPIDEQTADELRNLRKRQESLPDGKPAATPDESSFLGVGLVPAQEGGDSPDGTYGYIPSSVFAFAICAVVLIFATILVGILMTKVGSGKETPLAQDATSTGSRPSALAYAVPNETAATTSRDKEKTLNKESLETTATGGHARRGTEDITDVTVDSDADR